MSDVTDGLRVIVARPSHHRDMFVERQIRIEDDTQHLHILNHRKINTGDRY